LGWKISQGTEFSTTYPAGNSDNFNDTQNKSFRRYIAASRGSMSAIQDKPSALKLTPEIRFEKNYVTFLTV
jgi:hypothetical protein